MLAVIEKDSRFSLDGQDYVIERIRRSAGKICAYCEKTGEEFTWSFADISSKFAQGVLKFKSLRARDGETAEDKTKRQLLLLSQIERESILRKKGYVDAVTDDEGFLISGTTNQQRAINAHARVIGAYDKKPSPSTVRRWLARLNATQGNLLSLLRRENRKRLLPDNPESDEKFEKCSKKLFDLCVREYYLKHEKKPLKKVYKEMVRKVKEDADFEDIKVPHLSTLYRWLNEMSEYEKLKLRKGYLEANRQYPSGLVKEVPTYLMEAVELDHTALDILLVDKESGDEIGRPWMTAIIDRASRMILGFHIAMHVPNINSVILAVRHAILSKEYIKHKYGDTIVNDWPCMGFMDQIITDNGTELHSNQVQQVLGSYVDIQYNPKGTPQYKGMIERFFRTINEDLLHGLTGTTFSNYIKRGDYKSDKKAALTMNDLVQLVHIWIVDIYHFEFHREIKCSPIEFWNDNKHKHTVRLLEDIKVLDQLLWRVDTRCIQKYGIEKHTLIYQSPELMDIAKQHGMHTKVQIFVDEDDLGMIRVVIPGTEETIDVPCKDRRYVENRLSLKEHEKVKALLKTRNTAFDKSTEAAKLSARDEIDRIEQEAKISKKKAVRRTMARKNQKDSSNLGDINKKTIRQQSKNKRTKKPTNSTSIFSSVQPMEVESC